MKTTIKIITLVTILIGGTLYFAHWSYTNFDVSISEIDKNYQYNLSNVISTKTVNQSKDELSTSTSISLTQDYDINNFKYIFPAKPVNIYKSCNYTISWEVMGINSLEIALVDYVTGEKINETSSGIPRTIKNDSYFKNIDWKVGNVLPGRYYIVTSKINDTPLVKTSASVNIMNLPNNIGNNEIESFCEQN